MKNKYVIVISFDAVSEEDLEFLSKQPNFSKVNKKWSINKKCRKCLSIFNISGSCNNSYRKIS